MERACICRSVTWCYVKFMWWIGLVVGELVVGIGLRYCGSEPIRDMFDD